MNSFHVYIICIPLYLYTDAFLQAYAHDVSNLLQHFYQLDSKFNGG